MVKPNGTAKFFGRMCAVVFSGVPCDYPLCGMALERNPVWKTGVGDAAVTEPDEAQQMLNRLWIACPCALGSATPMSIMVGIGRGAREAILIKDAAALERLEMVATLLVDKTGTLTEGKPCLSQSFPTASHDQNTLLQLAATVGIGLHSQPVYWQGVPHRSGVGNRDRRHRTVANGTVLHAFAIRLTDVLKSPSLPLSGKELTKAHFTRTPKMEASLSMPSLATQTAEGF